MRSLADWLEQQQKSHPSAIDLDLTRVRSVAQRLGLLPPPFRSIIVAGTNGKGSTVACLDTLLRVARKRTGRFTSPHLVRYNERICIDGSEASDAALVGSFERIEAARGATTLTFFEYNTLAALDLFTRAQVDVAVLEVGLGGRLDATNIVDADVGVVCSIGLDHVEWLGDSLQQIGREKAGIFRAGRPAIIGESDPPHSLLSEAQRIGARALRAGHDYTAHVQGDRWIWKSGDTSLELPLPELSAPSQLANAAAAIAAVHALRNRLDWNPHAIAQGVRGSRVAGRLQEIAKAPQVIVDVAHNPQAARELARWLEANPGSGETFAVFGALRDKDVESIVRALQSRFTHWYLAGLEHDSPRGLPVAQLAARVRATAASEPFSEHADVSAALAAARQRAKPNDRILVFGSFFMVAAAMR